ncbi:hypothetical protein GR268_46935 [Rhizobium leguminosarum]|nr:hypothetical protein [Rhizobium leguminosarum]
MASLARFFLPFAVFLTSFYALVQAIEAALAKSFVEPIYAEVDGRIALSNGTRMTCVAPDQRICSNNGYCKAGVCQCTAPEAAGTPRSLSALPRQH